MKSFFTYFEDNNTHLCVRIALIIDHLTSFITTLEIDFQINIFVKEQVAERQMQISNPA